MVSQLVKKFPAFYGNLSLISAFIRAQKSTLTAISDKVPSALGKSMYEDGDLLDCEPCGLLDRHQSFGRIYCIRLED
jgi:hypothetical protein